MKKRNKMMAGLLVAAMSVSMLSACSSEKQTAETPAATIVDTATAAKEGELVFTPGIYTGTAKGYNGDITVEVTVDEKRIKEVKVVNHSDSAGISDGAFNKLPGSIVDNQSLALDTIAGCTMSSKGILDAVEHALKDKCSDPALLKKEVKKSQASAELIEKTADVVIIGAGGAGMSAAVEVINSGSSVIIIEKMPAPGGNTILAGSAYNAADPERQKAVAMNVGEKERVEAILKLETENDMLKSWQDTLKNEWEAYKTSKETYLFDSPSLHKLQTYLDGDSIGDPALIDIMGDQALEGINFLSDLGADWIDGINAGVGATWVRSHTPTMDFGAKGAAFVMPQVNYVTEKGGEIILEAKAEELIMENGLCVGVKGAKTDGQPFEIHANKGVILATGGFGANVEMRQNYNKQWANLDESVPTTNHVGATGDGIIMAEEAGANLVGMEWIQMLPTYGSGVFTAYIENQMYINKEGNRFVKEDGRRDELSKSILEQTDAQIYILSDANTVEDGKVKTTGLDVDERIGKGYIWKAETLEELCKQIHVPYEAVQASVDQLNTSVKEGNDPFGRTVFDQEFGKGPYYAGLTNPMVHHTMGGVQIDTDTHVLDAQGNIIPGLYAAGEVTGGVHGGNRLGGNAIADITVFGRIAGQNAVTGK